MTTDTNPTRFAHACAGRSIAHRSMTGVAPIAASVPSDAPTARFASAAW